MRFLIILFLLFQSNLVNAFELNGEITQGALIIGKEQTYKTIYINKQKIKLSKKGIFVFGINYNQTGNVVIESVDKNNQVISKTYEIKKRQYKIQKIVTNNFVTVKVDVQKSLLNQRVPWAVELSAVAVSEMERLSVDNGN